MLNMWQNQEIWTKSWKLIAETQPLSLTRFRPTVDYAHSISCGAWYTVILIQIYNIYSAYLFFSFSFAFMIRSFSRMFMNFRKSRLS